VERRLAVTQADRHDHWAPYIDVDDVRQLVVAGAEAPWRGTEGAAQAMLGVLNACAVARNFRAAGFNVVVVDVLTATTAATVREHLQDCLLVRLAVDLAEAQRRAATRPVWLTDQEFVDLHRQDAAAPPPVDATLDVAGMDGETQQAAVEAVWAAST
jgi:hypothetical protein